MPSLIQCIVPISEFKKIKNDNNSTYPLAFVSETHVHVVLPSQLALSSFEWALTLLLASRNSSAKCQEYELNLVST